MSKQVEQQIENDGDAFLASVTGSGQAQEAPTLKAPSSVAPRAAEDGGALEVVSTGGVAAEEERAKRLSEKFTRAKTLLAPGLRAMVDFGLELIDLKASMKRGQWIPWVQRFCPDVHVRTAQRWMGTAEAALCLATGHESIKEIRHDVVFRKCPVGNLLQIEDSQLPQEVVEIQAKVLEVIDGKTAKEVDIAFKDANPRGRGGDNTPRDEQGRRIQKGWGSKNVLDKEQAEELVNLYCQKLRFIREGQTLAIIGDAKLRELEAERVELGHKIREILDSRRKGKRQA